MANLLRASNNHKVTWRQGTTLADNGDIVGCLHITLKDENNKDIAKACLTSNQLAAYCLNNNKLDNKS